MKSDMLLQSSQKYGNFDPSTLFSGAIHEPATSEANYTDNKKLNSRQSKPRGRTAGSSRAKKLHNQLLKKPKLSILNPRNQAT